MAICHKNVLPAIVIKINEPCAPGEKGDGRLAHSKLKSKIEKIASPLVVKQSVVVIRKIGDVKIHFAIVVIITHRNAHGCLFASGFAEGESGRVADIFERPIAQVPVEIPGRRIIRYDQVRPSVVIHVHPRRGKTVIAIGVGYAGFHRDFRKRAIAVVVK